MSVRKIACLGVMLLVISVRLADAQQAERKVYRIGVLRSYTPSVFATRNEAFHQGLHDLGYVEGKNILIEYRYAEGRLDRLPQLAAELVHLKVDVIVTGGNQATLAAKQATSTIPIVAASAGDLVRRERHRVNGYFSGLKWKTTGHIKGSSAEGVEGGYYFTS